MANRYEVHFKGFSTKARADEFASWFEGQGEQDCAPWMNEHAGCDIYTDTVQIDITAPNLVEVLIREVTYNE